MKKKKAMQYAIIALLGGSDMPDISIDNQHNIISILLCHVVHLKKSCLSTHQADGQRMCVDESNVSAADLIPVAATTSTSSPSSTSCWASSPTARASSCSAPSPGSSTPPGWRSQLQTNPHEDFTITSQM